MRSVKSWFNPTLFRKNMTRFWPVWGLYLVIWLFALPILLILNDDNADYIVRKYLFTIISPAGMLLAAVFALLAACAVWSYLCNGRSACLLHTLPIRREGLFLTNFLSGLAFFVGPNLVVFLLTWLAEIAVGMVDVGALVMWLFSITLIELAFFCFATFCAVFTGHVLGLPAFYVILNVLAIGLMTLIQMALSRFLFGYAGLTGVWKAVTWLTPVWKLAVNLEARYVGGVWRFVGLGYILIYAFFGLILAAVALAVYRRRDMERAGDVVTVPRMRPVFQYGVAFCCALAFGTLFYTIFESALPNGAWTLLGFMLLCGAAGYFLARMLLEKSFRVFRFWKGCIPFLAALVVLACVMEFDLTGFESRVPDEEEVASVQIANIYTTPYDTGRYGNMRTAIIETGDPEIIRAVLAAHQAIVDDRETIQGQNYVGGSWMATDEAGYSVQTAGYSGFQVVYSLKDGSTISRSYTGCIPVLAQELNDPASPAAKLDALVNLPQTVDELYGLRDQPAEKLMQVTLTESGLEWADSGQLAEVAPKDRARVLEAVLADIEEGNLRRYLLEDKEQMENCFVNTLTFTFYSDEQQDASVDSGLETEPGTYSIMVTLQTGARHTLAVLREEGVLTNPVNLMTQAQQAQSELLSDLYYAKGESGEGIDLEDYIWGTLGE